MPAVGRKRTRNPDWLPKRCYPHRACAWFYPKPPKPDPGQPRQKPPKPINLGPLSDPSTVLAAYGKLIKADPKKPPRTIGDGIDKWMIEELPKLGEGSQETYRLYCGNLKKGLGALLPEELTIQHLYDYHEAREAPVRANREVSVFCNTIWPHFIRWRMATAGIGAEFIYAEEKDRDRDVSGSERRRFARQCCPPWLRGYITLKYLAGRRQKEMLPLSTFSEGREGLSFQIAKKRRKRTIIIRWTPKLRRTWEWLKALPRPEHCTWIFWARKGKNKGKAPLTKSGFKSAWQRAQTKWIEMGGEPFWEHDLRAATATASDSDHAAQEILDHEDVRVTRKRYRRARVSKVNALR